MGKYYYKVLGVDKQADDDAIKKGEFERRGAFLAPVNAPPKVLI
jgi:hypothetical protein